MNERMRILLLALMIVATVASDPPVASYFERPHTACRVAANLAVGAFDTLVRSTLPLPSFEPENESSDEILVAGAPQPETDATSTSATVESRAVEKTPVKEVVVASTLRTVAAEPVVVHSGCSGSDREAVEVLRVEAVMEITASPIGQS